jgi:hypothetical protein
VNVRKASILITKIEYVNHVVKLLWVASDVIIHMTVQNVMIKVIGNQLPQLINVNASNLIIRLINLFAKVVQHLSLIAIVVQPLMPIVLNVMYVKKDMELQVIKNNVSIVLWPV